MTDFFSTGETEIIVNPTNEVFFCDSSIKMFFKNYKGDVRHAALYMFCEILKEYRGDEEKEEESDVIPFGGTDDVGLMERLKYLKERDLIIVYRCYLYNVKEWERKSIFVIRVNIEVVNSICCGENDNE